MIFIVILYRNGTFLNSSFGITYIDHGFKFKLNYGGLVRCSIGFKVFLLILKTWGEWMGWV